MLSAAGLQPITWEDYDIYQSFFRAAPGTAVYANSWTYITQACRGLGLGWKYLDGDRLFSIGRHNGHYVLVNPLGCLDERLAGLLHRLHAASGKPVFIKKASDTPAAALEKIGVRPSVPGGDIWEAGAHADDDTYPELIVSPEISLGHSEKPSDWLRRYRAAAGGIGIADEDAIRTGFRQFRRYVRRADESNVGCSVVEYRSHAAGVLKRWVEGYFGPARPAAPRAYDALLEGLRRGVGHRSGFCFVVKTAGAPGIVGMVFGERLDSGSAAIYARLIHRAHSGLPEYAMAQVLAHLQSEGIQRVNLGGSETEGLHKFKLKLAPVEQRRLPLLVYGNHHRP